MRYKLKAFTLTELLIALGIIGAIAALSIPSLMNAINNRMMVTQLKSNITAIQQLASDSLVTSSSRSLEDTDFSDPAKLLTEGNFAIQKKCPNPAADCWKTRAATNPVTYYSFTKTKYGIAGANYPSIILKNGAVVGYNTVDEAITGTTEDRVIGEFCFDINGSDYPNIPGRDYFCAKVTKKGRIIDLNNPNITTETKIQQCKAGAGANFCFGAIVDSGWTMPY